MHVDDLPISSTSTDRRCDNDQCVFIDEVSYASLVLGAVAGVCDEVEFEGLRERDDDKKDENELDNRRVPAGGRSHDSQLRIFRGLATRYAAVPVQEMWQNIL